MTARSETAQRTADTASAPQAPAAAARMTSHSRVTWPAAGVWWTPRSRQHVHQVLIGVRRCTVIALQRSMMRLQCSSFLPASPFSYATLLDQELISYRCSSACSSSCWNELLKKVQGSVVSNRIGMKFGRIGLQVNMHRLTECSGGSMLGPGAQAPQILPSLPQIFN